MKDPLVTLAAVYFTHNRVPVDEIGRVIRSIRLALGSSDMPVPAVPIGESVQEDYIVCLEDGHRVKMLKRYLGQKFNLTPEEYRERWGLEEDYPMVCPSYSAQRSQIALTQGLGLRSPAQKGPPSSPPARGPAGARRTPK